MAGTGDKKTQMLEVFGKIEDNLKDNEALSDLQKLSVLEHVNGILEKYGLKGGVGQAVELDQVAEPQETESPDSVQLTEEHSEEIEPKTELELQLAKKSASRAKHHPVKTTHKVVKVTKNGKKSV